jgi:hypothetical protein
MASGITELRASGPLELVDGALLAVRRGGGGPLLRAWAGSAPLALCALAVYYLERVEGLRSLRVPLALLLVLAFWGRALLLSRVAREYALAIRPTLPVSEQPTRAIDVLCTASVVGFGLWAWLWPLGGMALLSPYAALAVVPFMALRGAIAPSWLARASCARERGFSAFGQAFDDTAGMRGVFLTVELLALLGVLGVFANLWAVMSFVLLLSHAMLGLEVAFVSSFLSPDNGWVLLANATLALVLCEPLRAALSAQAFVDARSRRDGADLHAAVDAAIAQANRRGRAGAPQVPPGAAALLLLGTLLAATPARAQETEPSAEPSAAQHAADEDTRVHVEQILASPDFREFAERDDKGVGEMIDKLLKALFGDDHDESDERHVASSTSFSRGTSWVLMGIALVALTALAAYAYASSGPRGRTSAVGSSAPIAISEGDRPVTLLDEAAALAARGDMRGALRALYVATLVMLDRKRLIEFEPWKTNGMYLRGMPQGEARRAFAAFTHIFDHKWYGHEPATAEDYQECRRLAERIGGEVGA